MIDFDGDGDLDIIEAREAEKSTVAGGTRETNRLLFNDGRGYFSAGVSFASPREASRWFPCPNLSLIRPEVPT